MALTPQLESFLHHCPPRNFWRYWGQVFPWMMGFEFGRYLYTVQDEDEFDVFVSLAEILDWAELIIIQLPYLIGGGVAYAVPVALVMSQMKLRKIEADSAPQSFWHPSPQSIWRYWWGAFPWMMGIEMAFRTWWRLSDGMTELLTQHNWFSAYIIKTSGHPVLFLIHDDRLNFENNELEIKFVEPILEAIAGATGYMLKVSIIGALAALIVAVVMRQRALWKAGTDSGQSVADNPGQD